MDLLLLPLLMSRISQDPNELYNECAGNTVASNDLNSRSTAGRGEGLVVLLEKKEKNCL